MLNERYSISPGSPTLSSTADIGYLEYIGLMHNFEAFLVSMARMPWKSIVRHVSKLFECHITV